MKRNPKPVLNCKNCGRGGRLFCSPQCEYQWGQKVQAEMREKRDEESQERIQARIENAKQVETIPALHREWLQLDVERVRIFEHAHAKYHHPPEGEDLARVERIDRRMDAIQSRIRTIATAEKAIPGVFTTRELAGGSPGGVPISERPGFRIETRK